MSHSNSSTPSIDNDSASLNHHSIPSNSIHQQQQQPQPQPRRSSSSRQGSISTLWSSADLPFFLDSRQPNSTNNHSPNSNQFSNPSTRSHGGNNTSLMRAVEGRGGIGLGLEWEWEWE